MALDALLSRLSSTRVTTILTFPEDDCSNGLSGKTVKAAASNYVEVHETVVLATLRACKNTTLLLGRRPEAVAPDGAVPVANSRQGV